MNKVVLDPVIRTQFKLKTGTKGISRIDSGATKRAI